MLETKMTRNPKHWFTVPTKVNFDDLTYSRKLAISCIFASVQSVAKEIFINLECCHCQFKMAESSVIFAQRVKCKSPCLQNLQKSCDCFFFSGQWKDEMFVYCCFSIIMDCLFDRLQWE